MSSTMSTGRSDRQFWRAVVAELFRQTDSMQPIPSLDGGAEVMPNRSTTLSTVATSVVALLMTASLAYGVVWTFVLFDGVSTHEGDLGYSMAYGLLFLLSIPVWLAVSCGLCFWVRHRFGFLAVCLLLVPLIAWGLGLFLRYTSADCGNALTRC